MGSSMFSLVIQGGGCSALFSILINQVITKDYGYPSAFYIYGVFTCITILLALILREKYEWKTYLSDSTKELMKNIDGSIKELAEEMETE